MCAYCITALHRGKEIFIEAVKNPCYFRRRYDGEGEIGGAEDAVRKTAFFLYVRYVRPVEAYRRRWSSIPYCSFLFALAN